MQTVDQRNMRWPHLFTDQMPISQSDNRTYYIILYTNRKDPYSEDLENLHEKYETTHTSNN